MTSSTRAPLTANGLFSLLSGALFLIAPSTVGDWLGVEIDGWLRLIGVGFLSHGLVLMWAARRAEPEPWAKLNLLAIAPYPVLMVVLVATGLIDRRLGQGLALIDGAAIAAIAAWHWLSLREPARVHQPQHA